MYESKSNPVSSIQSDHKHDEEQIIAIHDSVSKLSSREIALLPSKSSDSDDVSVSTNLLSSSNNNSSSNSTAHDASSSKNDFNKSMYSSEKLPREVMGQQMGYWAQLIENMRVGPQGSRGEEWFALQLLAQLCVLVPPHFVAESLHWIHPHHHHIAICHFHIPVIGYFLDTLLGPIALFFGFIFLLFSTHELGRFLSPFPRPTPGIHLVKQGVYGYVRHPLYASFLLLSLGWSKFTCNLPRLLFTVVLYFILEKKIQIEEKFLIERFGQSYKDYQKSVKKLIPYIY